MYGKFVIIRFAVYPYTTLLHKCRHAQTRLSTYFHTAHFSGGVVSFWGVYRKYCRTGPVLWCYMVSIRGGAGKFLAIVMVVLQVRLASSNISVLQSILSYCVSGTFPCSLFNDAFSVTRDYIAN
jgi:hypothetical protein